MVPQMPPDEVLQGAEVKKYFCREPEFPSALRFVARVEDTRLALDRIRVARAPM